MVTIERKTEQAIGAPDDPVGPPTSQDWCPTCGHPLDDHDGNGWYGYCLVCVRDEMGNCRTS